MIILARHGQTPANAAKYAGSAESRVQGFSREMPLSAYGETQEIAFGFALGRFVACHELDLSVAESSDAVRTEVSRELALQSAGLLPGVTVRPPDIRLRELCKGDYEGRLRSVVYGSEEIRERMATDWYFRHGSWCSGGETSVQASDRWLDWLADKAEEGFGSPDGPSLIAFGHNGVTSRGMWRALNPDMPLTSLALTRMFKTTNGTAWCIGQVDGRWKLLDSIAPTARDLQGL